MSSTTIFYILIALFISLSVAFFQYYYKAKKKTKVIALLFVLKAISLFCIGLLFINPSINTVVTKNIKPVLAVLVDNSLSTTYFNETKKAQKILTTIEENPAVQQKFNVQYFSFGNTVNVLDSLPFSETQTDISKAIFTVNELYKDNNLATVLITDGNQTKGNDYQFLNNKSKIFPVVLGDTIQYQDVQLSQLNVNKYSYIDNKFPVEALVYYEGKKEINTTFSIRKKGKKVFSKKITLSPDKPTETIITNITSNAKGLHYYQASVSKITNEKNTKNNSKSFSVDVIDEQTKVLVLSSFLHPDLGAIKKSIESNKQRKVTIAMIDDKTVNFNEYQFFVFYQPNVYFKSVFEKVKANFLVVTGTKTDWNFVNSLTLGISKKAINQKEFYAPVYNDGFSTFYQEDIGFNQFPPLQDKFGELTTSADLQSILYQKFAGVETTSPLLATIEKNNNKHGFLLGEGIWKWRAASFLKEQSFQKFDAFFSNLTQYLASTKKRQRLEINAERLYAANEPITISAFYVDKNYQFDARASLELTLINTVTKVQQKIPMSLVNNSYQVSVEGLNPGGYSYKVSVINQNIQRSKTFKMSDYQIEEQFTNANVLKLTSLAQKSKGSVFYPNQTSTLLKNIQDDSSYVTTQTSSVEQHNLIDWKWILCLVIALLSAEWFIRKYFGKI